MTYPIISLLNRRMKEIGLDGSAAMLQEESEVSLQGFTIPCDEGYSSKETATRVEGPCSMDAKIDTLFSFELSNGYMERNFFGRFLLSTP